MGSAGTAAKLLVLDLNNTLLLRYKSNGKLVPRPYLNTLLAYLFHASVSVPASGSQASSWRRAPNNLNDDFAARYEVMIWSSAQPHSVKRMIEKTFGEHRDSPLAVWDRTRLGLPRQDYNKKVPTIKDLQKVWKAYPRHSTKTTLLLDDSVDKAQLQSDNHICVSKYTADIRTKDEAEYTASLASQAEPVLDEMLIAVVGILEELRMTEDVSTWLGSGGLRRAEISEDLQGKESSEQLDVVSVEEEVSEASNLWFDDQDVLRHWVMKGRATLSALHICIEAGLANR